MVNFQIIEKTMVVKSTSKETENYFQNLFFRIFSNTI